MATGKWIGEHLKAVRKGICTSSFLLERKKQRTKENHKDDYRFRKQNFQRANKGIEITNYEIKNRQNVLPVYEWAHS